MQPILGYMCILFCHFLLSFLKQTEIQFYKWQFKIDKSIFAVYFIINA